MKTIRINGMEQSFPEGAILFEDFVSDLNKTLGEDQKVISSIRVNGKDLSEIDENAIRKTPIDQIGALEFETSSVPDLAYETLNTLEQYLDRLVSSIQRASLHYQAKNYISGDAYFSKAIDGLDLFVQTIGGTKLALRIGLNPRIALTEATLVSIMNDLLDAKRQNNYVFMAELLEKDLVENLQEWKNEVFPFMRAWKTA